VFENLTSDQIPNRWTGAQTQAAVPQQQVRRHAVMRGVRPKSMGWLYLLPAVESTQPAIVVLELPAKNVREDQRRDDGRVGLDDVLRRIRA
jgi:hypothetical protein